MDEPVKEALKSDELDNEEYEAQIVMLDDVPFEIIDEICFEGQKYVALVEYKEDDEEEESDEDEEFVILKEVEQDGETCLSTVDDENLYNRIGDAFIEHFYEMWGDEEEE